MKVADYIINYLANVENIKEAFVVYGAANGDIIDAFTRNENIKYISVMHEQAGGFMAEAYARVSENFGVAIATSGPGGMNFVTPMGNCFYESIPCLFITGQPNSKFLRKNKEIRQNAFQETDIVDIVKPISKYAVILREANQVKYELQKLLYTMKEGRPGPVLFDIPLDIQKQEIDENNLPEFVEPVGVTYRINDINYFIQDYILALTNAERPVIIVGGGVRLSEAVSEMNTIASILKIPVFPTWNGLDVITADNKYYGGKVGTYGGEGRNFAIQNSDLILGIGTRISGRITGGVPESFGRGAKKFIVDIDEAIFKEGNHDVHFDSTLACDAGVFLDQLEEYILANDIDKALNNKFEKWVDQTMEWKEKYDPVDPKYYDAITPVNPYVFARVLADVAKPEDVIVVDCGGNIVVMSQAFKTKYGQRFLTNNGNSPMGYSFAGSIGAWFASNPNQNVICVIGDGGMNMNIQELQTIKNYSAGVKVFIMNNHIYGITKQFQETNFNGRCEACGPVGYNPPDFIKVAEAYGIKTVVIDQNDVEIMKQQIVEVLSTPHNEPIVCDVNCHEFHTYEPRVFGWKTPIEDMYPYIDRTEFKNNMIIKPVEGWENPVMPDIIK